MFCFCWLKPLLGGLAIPLYGFHIVLRHATTFGIHHPEIALRDNSSLVTGSCAFMVALSTSGTVFNWIDNTAAA